MSAHDSHMRASDYHRSSEFYLHGLADDVALKAWRASRDTFVKAAELGACGFELLQIPFEGTALPGYFYKPDGEWPRPTLLLLNGFDGTQEESWFNIGRAAFERGYNVLTFEGPGQGAVIREQGLGFRHDYEKIVTPVVDYALTRPEIDPHRIALAALRAYSLVGIAQRSVCPTLVCDAQEDQFFKGQPEALFEALTCQKALMRFTAEDAAEEHCHVGANRHFAQRAFDWLDGILSR